MAQLERQYISFNVWNPATSATRPKENSFLPVYGLVGVLPVIGSPINQFQIFYWNNWLATIVHDTDVNNSVMYAFIRAFDKARHGSSIETIIEPDRSINIISYTIVKA